jgi:hypothetical protein
MRLVLDTLQIEQAKRELQSAENVLPRAARECYKWLLCPLQNSAADPKPTVEGFPLNTNGSGLGNEIERVCTENELVISAWSPVHLRSKLQELYWRPDKPAIEAMAFWEDTLRYLYLPRLKSREVLSQAIVKGAASTDFFGTAYGQHDSKFDGFKIGDPNVQLDDTLLLIQPEVAIQYQKALLDVSEPTVGNSTSASVLSSNATKTGTVAEPIADRALAVTVTTQRKAMAFHSSVEVHAATAKVRMVQLADEIISILASDPQANLRITLEINADFPAGVSDQIKRAVSENSKSLGFEAIWE